MTPLQVLQYSLPSMTLDTEQLQVKLPLSFMTMAEFFDTQFPSAESLNWQIHS